MRSEKPEPGPMPGRLRGMLARAGGWLASQGPGPRLALILGALGSLAAAVYLAVPSEPVPRAWLDGGRAFARDDVLKIARALDAAGIDHVRDEQGRIQIPADRLREAVALLEKGKVVPLSVADTINAIREPGSWVEAPIDRDQRLKGNLERALEAMIERLPGISSASVMIRRERSRGGLRAGWNVSGFVYLETVRDRGLSYDTIQSIQTFLVGAVPDLKPDAISLVDDNGRPYLAVGNPRLRAISLTRARENELVDQLAEQLDWITGVRVRVRIETPEPVPAETPPARPAAAATPAPLPIAVASAAPPAPAPLEPTLAPNRPVELEPEPEADFVPDLPPLPGPAPAPAVAAAIEADPTTPAPTVATEAAGKVLVWIQVPRSYYLRELRASGMPSAEELAPLVARVRGLIDSAVVAVVARGDFEVKVDTIPDDPGPFRASSPVGAGESRRPLPVWLPVAVAVGVALALLMLAAVRALASRRPVRRSEPAQVRRRYDVGEPATPGPGPTERVRDLVRHNPEAAAGVLQRWIGQGGHPA